jgi:hypothetical protein
MVQRVYRGTAYRQSTDKKAPWLVSFVAPAEQVLEWAGIPRKSDKAIHGFQRAAEESRVLRAKEYFRQFSMNQSPTSVVMGLHPQHGIGAQISLELEGDSSGAIVDCKLIVTYDPLEPLNQVVDRLRAQITMRLASEIGSVGDEDLDASQANQVDDVDELDEAADSEAEQQSTDNSSIGEQSDDNSAADQDVQGEEIELGRSLLRDFLERLQELEWCESNEMHLRDLAKPATIIDGQHRILGAQLTERSIPFSIIAIHDCSWAEQVFQFTVVNYTAKGIPDQFITANAALSLTAEELQDLESRLQQAGVKIIEYELMRVINFDDESPFKDLVNLTPKKVEGLVGYKTMVQIGKAWYQGRDNAVRQIIDNLYPDLTGKGKALARSRIERWKEEHWGEFFKDFWNTVRDHYSGEKSSDGTPLWSVGSSNLMITVVLQCLQEEFLRNLAAQDETFFEVPPENSVPEMRAKLRKRAKTFISYFKPDFFAREWKMKSLSIGPGRMALRDVLREIVDSKGAFQYGKSAVVTGKTAAS